MTEWQIVLLTGAISCGTALVTALVTSAVTHRNEAKKQVMESRANLYFDFCNEAEKLLNNRFTVYDKEYIDAILTFKPKFKLLASRKTIEAFKTFYDSVISHYKEYTSYCNENNPYNDPQYRYIECDAEGVEHEEYNVPNFEMSYFENAVKKYKNEHVPSYETVSGYFTDLYEQMRKDLGSNIK